MASNEPSPSVTAPTLDRVTVGNRSLYRSEWRASTYSVSAQEEPALGLSDDGGVIAVWSSRRQQAGKYGVYAQRFSPEGVAIGSETPVSLYPKSHAMTPAIDVGPDGHATVVWQSSGQDGDRGGVLARRLDGSLAGSSELLVNENAEGHQGEPVVATRSDGAALAVWTSMAQLRGDVTLRGRLIDASGAAAGPEFEIPTGAAAVRCPSVALLSDGGFAVSYAVLDENWRESGVRLRRLSAEGVAMGDEVVVSDAPGSIEPVIAAAGDGLVVAWLDVTDNGMDYQVVARRFDALGRCVGDRISVGGDQPMPQSAAAVAARDDGSFVIAWNGPDADGTGVFGRAFGADGTPEGGAFRITAHEKGDQLLRAVAGTRRLAFTPGGGLVCVWSGDAGRGDSSSVNVTLLSPAPAELAGRALGITPEMAAALPEGSDAYAGIAAEPHEPPTRGPRRSQDLPREIASDGTGFDAVLDTGWTPPDPSMAVGPNHVVVMTNGEIAFFTKAGVNTFSQPIEDSFGFWGSVGATGFVFDPEVLYDPMSGRFFAMAAEGFAPGNRSFGLIAISDDSDPNGSWTRYRFDTTSTSGNLFDSPNIGVTSDAIVLTGDGFGIGANYPMYFFNKAAALGGTLTLAKSQILATSTQSAGLPPVLRDAPPALYMAEHKEAASNTVVRLLALRNLTGAGALIINEINVTVPSYGGLPEDPPQLGSSSRPNTFDSRFWSVSYADGSLWATQHINSDRVVARWYEFRMNGWPTSGMNPTLAQSGNIDLGSTVRTFFSAITVNDEGDAAMVFGRSSPTERLSMAHTYRLSCDPLNTMRPAVTDKASTTAYTSGRWGDYAAVQQDPVVPGTFWAVHEYATGAGFWRVWVQSFETAACPADFNKDCTLNFFDFIAFQDLFSVGDPKACDCDLSTGAGVCDFFDFVCFQDLFAAGCP